MLELDDLLTADKPEQPRQAATESPELQKKRANNPRGVLKFDLETIPDYDRAELFELEPIPPKAERKNVIEVAEIEKGLDATIDSVKSWLQSNNFADAILDSIESAERKLNKPRKGVFDAIADLRRQDDARNELIETQRKKMSCTPEMCRIVAFGFRVDDEIESMVVGVNGCTETEILHAFWLMAKQTLSVCGFNIIGFDLPVIMTRSILLDVHPSKIFDLRPWGNQVLDLMAKRWPKGGQLKLKTLAKLLGIPVPAGDVDGSQTEELWRNDPAKLGEYVRSDVHLVDEIYLRYRNLFF